jgi:tripartite-type tricarboxylate transporter receptor subunit TctC
MALSRWRGPALSLALAMALSTAGQPADAQESDALKDKTITMIIGYAPGGGTDIIGRAIAASIDKYLPGNPKIVVSNMPGAEGTTAGNYFSQQAPADGTTIMMGAATQADPIYYRRPQSRFNPTTFKVIGGVTRGGTALFVSKTAENRLYDKKLPPVNAGTLGGVPRAGNQVIAWGAQFLNWNIKWVVGYPGTNEILAALDRGEIDMTSTNVLSQTDRLTASGKFTIVSQSGSLDGGRFVPYPRYGNAPLFSDLIKDKLTAPVAAQAFAYWSAFNSIEEWMSLPPSTPQPIVDLYRTAYNKLIADPEFLDMAKKLGDFTTRTNSDVEFILNTLNGTSTQATGYITTMLRGQGLQVE